MGKSIFSIVHICVIMISSSIENRIWAQKPEKISYITIVPKVAIDKSTWCVVEEPATFPGGITAWTKYMFDSTKYPEYADRLLANQSEGTATIQFIISKEGLTTEVQSLDTVQNCFTEEAVRVIRNSPRWMPAKRNGRACSYRMVQGFTFLWQPPELPRIAAYGGSINSVALLQPVH